MAEDTNTKSGSILSKLFWLLVILILVYVAVVNYAASSLQYEETGVRYMTNQEALYTDSNVRNILVIGSDTRDADRRGRADSMILVSISEHNKTITVTSLMRDCYVNIPNHGRNKLNAAYAYGGASLLMDTIEANFHIDVDHYIAVDFFAFIAVVDALGGVEITMSDAEAEGVNDVLAAGLNELVGDDRNADFLDAGGTLLLTGKQALAYSRLRYVGHADYERTARQRTVFAAILDRATRFNPVGWVKVIHDALPLLGTNMEQKTIVGYGMEAPLLLTQYEMQSLRIPADGTYRSDMTSGGAAILRVDFDENLAIFKEAVQTPLETETEASSAAQ